ncbi:MAG: bifunctional UDP-N-acetylglucosamine diphosphorylase/glucosamine-1-phosphate N-acetyltransferase GlmU [Cyanophyceae cyanobacterium]|mgnify:FL=1
MVAVAILAAGKGTRMKSDLPKVLHSLGSKTLVERVLDSLDGINVERCLVVVGHQADLVRSRLADVTINGKSLEFVEQTEQLGTGHAVQQVLEPLKDFEGDLLVLNGDVPLLRPSTLQSMLSSHRDAASAATLLTAQLSDPTGYGRVFCDESGDQLAVQEIIEHRDCSPEQRNNNRINAGIYCFRWADLSAILPNLSNDNDQQEYYLTDVLAQLRPAIAVDVEDPQEIWGINDRVQLSAAYQVLQQRIKEKWMRVGVTILDPASVTIDDAVELVADVVIEPQTHLRGATKIAAGAIIGPGSTVENAVIGADAKVLHSVVMDSEVGPSTRVGPFAHLRGNAVTGEGCRIGNFVELKKTTLGDRTNVSHLSYLGDATVGNRSNIGAGTITANYDGVNKHKTVIGDRTKTGSNSVLVAPITLGDDVTVGAGSTITKNVQDDALVVARSRQMIKPGWRLKSRPSTEKPSGKSQ